MKLLSRFTPQPYIKIGSKRRHRICEQPLKLRTSDSPLRSSHEYKLQTGSFTTDKAGRSEVTSYDMLNEQLYYSSPAKHGANI